MSKSITKPLLQGLSDALGAAADRLHAAAEAEPNPESIVKRTRRRLADIIDPDQQENQHDDD